MENLLNHMKDLEQQEDLMAEASSETARYCVFKTDNLCMIVGIVGDRKTFEDVLRMDEDIEVRYDEEKLSDEEGFEWLQQKEFIDELLNGRRQ